MAQKLSKGMKIFIIVASVIAALLLTAILVVSIHTVNNRVKLNVVAAQVDQTQDIKVSWDTDKSVDKVTIAVTHNGKAVSTVTLSSTNDLAKGYYSIGAYYGNQDVKVTVKRKGVATSETKNVKLYADEYNFAPLVATMPVTMFSVDINNITNGGTIPTFVWLERAAAWNYSNLPDNVYLLPTVNVDKVTTKQTRQLIYTETAKYVKELAELNESSTFHFYYNDWWISGLFEATFANGLDTSRWDAVLLSDGTATFASFNEMFNNENADANYAIMLEKYNATIEEIKTKKHYKEGETGFTLNPGIDLKNYAYIVVEQNDNITWKITGLTSAFAPNNATWKAKASALATRLNLGDYFNPSKPVYLNDDQQNQLKKLYNLDAVSTVFSDAEAAGKKVMVILGSSPTSETNNDFELKAKALQAFYGDEYVYCYKGHPGYPSYQDKIDHMAEIGLVDLDSSIAAEFFFFFYPNAYAAGLESSTFSSVPAEHTIAYFSGSKATLAGKTLDYKDNFDICMTKNGDGNILMEFADNYSEDFDTAIYNATTGVITYYKDGNPVEL